MKKKDKLSWGVRVLAVAAGLVFAPIMFGFYGFLTNIPLYDLVPMSLLGGPIFAVLGFLLGPGILAILSDFR